MKCFDLQTALQNIDKVTELSLSKRQYTEAPEKVFLLKKLKKLDLSQNQLTFIPPQIAGLTDLTELDLSDNQLEALPAEMAELHALQKLDLSINRLKELPEWISELKALTHLDISGQGLHFLPQHLFDLANLALLNLSYNQLVEIPGQINKLKKLRRLLLNSNQLEKLPVQLGALPLLFELDISQNKLKRIPPELGRLTSLSILKASNNQLDALPSALSKATMLRQLDLSFNRFKKFPLAALGATWLSRINLQGNLLEKLPGALTGLGQLDALILESNRLKTLPACLGSLPLLRELHLSDNCLRTYKWPVKDGYTALERLHADDNPVAPQAKNLLALPKLNELVSDDKTLNHWLCWFGRQHTPPDWRLMIYQWLVEQDKRALARAFKRPSEVLNMGFPAFDASLRAMLYEQFQQPLSPGSVVYPLGYIASDLDELRIRLSRHDILLKDENPAAATHFLLGMPPLALPAFRKGKQAFISERDLVHDLDCREGLHLIHISEETEPQTRKALLQLLYSEQEANRHLVAEMLRRGGAPLSLLPQAFEYRAQHIGYETEDPLDSLFRIYLSDADKLYWRYLADWRRKPPTNDPRQPVPPQAEINWDQISF